VARAPTEEEEAYQRAKEGGKQRRKESEDEAGEGEDEPAETEEEEEEEEELGVFVIDEDLARFVTIRMGISDDKHVEIAAGVEEGQQVVEGPLRALRDLKSGARVKAKEKGDEKKGRGGRD
jgi:hypothetical protein